MRSFLAVIENALPPAIAALCASYRQIVPQHFLCGGLGDLTGISGNTAGPGTGRLSLGRPSTGAGSFLELHGLLVAQDFKLQRLALADVFDDLVEGLDFLAVDF